MTTLRGHLTSVYAVGTLCALGLLTACGSGGTEGGTGVGPSGMPSATPSATPSGTPPSGTPLSSGSPVMPPSGRARPTTMTGQVTSVEGGCVVFKDARSPRQWVLIGETRGLLAGTAYAIEGVAMDAMDPACPQALPFHVTKATPSDFVEDLPLLPSATKGAGAVVRLTGLVTSGVEAGCRVLQTDEGVFVLTGMVSVQDGTRVTVSGVKRLDQASICQQGPVLEVLTMTPADD